MQLKLKVLLPVIHEKGVWQSLKTQVVTAFSGHNYLAKRSYNFLLSTSIQIERP